jgi:hypothetical protein
MRYVAFIRMPQEAVDAWRSMPAESRAEGAQRHREWAARHAGRLVASIELGPAADAHVLRSEDGELVVTDGPFAESRDVLGGFFILDAPDLASARRITAEWPGIDTPGATIELMPVIDTVST